MQFMPDRRTFISIGGISIQWYAIIILIGALLAYFISSSRFKKNNIYIDLSDYFVTMMLFGIIGARIWYCIFMFDELYSNDILGIFRIWEGGLAIQGGVIAGLIYSVFYFRKHQVSLLLAGDCIMPTVLLAQSIGRWGNFMNQEAYGQVMTEAEFDALHLPEFIKEGMFINGSYYQPTFLYESVLNFIGFLLIIFVLKKLTNIEGMQFSAYFIWYGCVRFVVEIFRSDSLMLGSLKMAQVTSIAFVIGGLALAIYSWKRGKRYA